MYGQPAALWQKGFGARDYLELFDPNAPWTTAASRVHIFKYYMYAYDNLPDTQLRQIISDLNRRGIAIALETQPLNRRAQCGNSEAFAYDAVAQTLARLRRIRAAGGKVQYIAMDEPLTFGKLPPPEGCSLSIEEIAQEVAHYVRAVKREFPDVVIGDIEYEGAGIKDVKHFLEGYNRITGEYLPFLHWDINWQQPIAWWPVDWSQRRFLWPEWPERAKDLQDYCSVRGIKFGMIYNGGNAPSDEEWIRLAIDHMAMYESLGGRPDHVVFQSWFMHPQYLLPETDPTKFTYLINYYFTNRSVLSLEASPAGEVTGKLTDTNGTPISNAPIEVLAKPSDGLGVFGEYTITAQVPDGATQAIVGFRVNTECDCSGHSEFSLYEVYYREGDEKAQRVPNGNFSQGLNGWSYLTLETVQVRPSDIGTGFMLQVKATDGQKATTNSAPFPVTGGATFTLTFKARVAPLSVGSGYFAIFFLTGTSEVSRMAIPIEPSFLVYNVETDDNGNFRFTLPGLPPGQFVLQAKYGGNTTHWPAYARIYNIHIRP